MIFLLKSINSKFLKNLKLVVKLICSSEVYLKLLKKKCEDDFTIKCFEEKRQKKDHLTELLKLSSDKRLLQTDKIISMIKNNPLCLEEGDMYGNTVLQ